MMKILSRLWPPLGLRLASQTLGAQSFDDRWQAALDASKLEIDLDLEEEIGEAEKLAVSVLESETRRKDVLESKASLFVVSPTVATALVTAVAPLARAIGLPQGIATFVGLCYGLALIHLLVSTWYAISARRVEGFVVISAANAVSLLHLSKLERAENLLAYARQNEPALTLKSNQLSVAEDLFLRGLAFLAMGAVSALGALVLTAMT